MHISIVQVVCMIIRMCSLQAVGMNYNEVMKYKL